MKIEVLKAGVSIAEAVLAIAMPMMAMKENSATSDGRYLVARSAANALDVSWMIFSRASFSLL